MVRSFSADRPAEYNPGMSSSAVIIGALGLAAASLVVWLPIRILNRGWRDKKARLGIGLLLALLSYPAMLGPSCWISSRSNCGAEAVAFVYGPMILFAFEESSPTFVWDFVMWYSELAADSFWHWELRELGRKPPGDARALPSQSYVRWLNIDSS